VSAAAGWEWRYLRGALVGLAAFLLLEIVGWQVYLAVHDETPPLEETVRCLTREKLLELEPASRDPIAATARRGWIATRVEGNGVHLAIAGSESEAREIVLLYRRVSSKLARRLERRSRVVYLWEGDSTSTQRQTLYDCHYE
jgi:hypothetical protein